MSALSKIHVALNLNSLAVFPICRTFVLKGFILPYFLLLFKDAPFVKVHPTSSFVVEGNNITLNCVASGRPEPVLSWTKVGASGQVLSENPFLIVSNVRRPGTLNNMIQYQCTAENGVENPAFAIAKITVHCKYNGFVNGFCYICTKVFLGRFSPIPISLLQ